MSNFLKAIADCLFPVKYFLPKSYQRNNEVHAFRIRMIEENMDVYLSLPSYEEMLTDGKELKIESYFPNAKI